MEACYINLVIIPRVDGRAMGTTTQPSTHLEPKDATGQIALKDFFSARQLIDKTYQWPRRILVRGHAGVGKTTLGKKIVYDFTHNCDWEVPYNRNLWVLLRKLNLRSDQPYSLTTLFRGEFFRNILLPE